MIRVVLDTNVVISGLFWKGNPHRLLMACKERKLKMVTSVDLLEELKTVLLREKKFGLNEKKVKEIITAIAQVSEIVVPKERLSVIKEHLSDNRVLECAKEGNAQYIISGDKHLLSLEEYKGIKIVKPTEAVKLFLPQFFLNKPSSPNDIYRL